MTNDTGQTVFARIAAWPVSFCRVLGGLWRWALLSAGFAGVAIWSLWPSLRSPYETLPTSSPAVATVPMFNAWTIWWNADRLTHGLVGYWDAPIFHPEPGAFAFSEPQPATCVVAPLVWLTGSPVPAYHVYLLGSLVLNGLFAARLLRSLRIGWFGSVVGGLTVLLLPLVHQNRDIVQLVPLWGILWTLETLLRLWRRPDWRRGVESGCAFSAVFFTSVHHGLFFVWLLALSGWLLVPWPLSRRWLASLACAAFAAGLLLGPLLWPMRQILDQHAFRRGETTVESLSATLADWRSTAPHLLSPADSDSSSPDRPLSPGWLRVTLAAVGVAICLRQRRRRRAAVFLVVFGGWALAWSFGLNLSLGTWYPWRSLTEAIPAFARVRSVYRFGYFVQLALVLLAAVGVGGVARIVTVRLRRQPARWVARGILAATALAMVFEVPPPPLYPTRVPDVSTGRPWIAFLQQQTPPGRAVVCLPFVRGRSEESFHWTTRWMLYGTRHRVPLVNGYSGFFPDSWRQMQRALNRDPFAASSLSLLAAADVEYLVLRTRSVQARIPPESVPGGFRLERVFVDERGIEIWRLVEPPGSE
jgi:hypothetical protein